MSQKHKQIAENKKKQRKERLNMKIYKFKHNKHSVAMKLIAMDNDGNCVLQDTQYPIQHYANIKDLEEVKDE